MKRSEMLKLIANSIYNSTFRTSMLETLPLAEKLLKDIEEAGMIPPLTKFKDPELIVGYEFEYESCEWEPEE